MSEKADMNETHPLLERPSRTFSFLLAAFGPMYLYLTGSAFQPTMFGAAKAIVSGVILAYAVLELTARPSEKGKEDA